MHCVYIYKFETPYISTKQYTNQMTKSHKNRKVISLYTYLKITLGIMLLSLKYQG